MSISELRQRWDAHRKRNEFEHAVQKAIQIIQGESDSDAIAVLRSYRPLVMTLEGFADFSPQSADKALKFADGCCSLMLEIGPGDE